MSPPAKPGVYLKEIKLACMKKHMTLRQVETSKDRAARFVENVLGDSERASEISAESPEEYAERKGIQILSNIGRRNTMPSKRQLEEELDEANQYIEELESKLDNIADLAGESDEEGDEEAEGEE